MVFQPISSADFSRFRTQQRDSYSGPVNKDIDILYVCLHRGGGFCPGGFRPEEILSVGDYVRGHFVQGDYVLDLFRPHQ